MQMLDCNIDLLNSAVQRLQMIWLSLVSSVFHLELTLSLKRSFMEKVCLSFTNKQESHYGIGSLQHTLAKLLANLDQIYQDLWL